MSATVTFSGYATAPTRGLSPWSLPSPGRRRAERPVPDGGVLWLGCAFASVARPDLMWWFTATYDTSFIQTTIVRKMTTNPPSGGGWCLQIAATGTTRHPTTLIVCSSCPILSAPELPSPPATRAARYRPPAQLSIISPPQRCITSSIRRPPFTGCQTRSTSASTFRNSSDNR